MRILLLAPSFPPAVESGGPVRSLANLVARHRDDHSFCVITGVSEQEAASFTGLSGRKTTSRGVEVFYVDFANPAHIASAWRLLGRRRFDLVLVNSIWNRHLSLVPLALRRVGFQRQAEWVLAPRGELDPGALALRPHRKRIASRVVFPLIRSTVDVLSATSDIEEQQARRLLGGIRVVRATNIPDNLLPRYAPSPEGRLRIVFLGRITRKKGLLEALDCLKDVPEPVSLSIYGPVEDAAYWSECRKAMAELGEATKVVYRGVVGRPDVADCFAEADLFLFPTRGENFGHTIAESLQVGCPVVVPNVTPWTQYLSDLPDSVVPAECSREELAAAVSAWARRDQESLAHSRRLARHAFDRWAQDGAPDMLESVVGGAASARG